LNELLEEWLVNNRGISSFDEFFEAGGREDKAHIYFDQTGAKMRRYFGGEPANGSGFSELYLNTTQQEQ
jgi:hypothetical protein